MTLTEMKNREVEYVATLTARILERDAVYRKHEKTAAARSRPLRGGGEWHTREWFWRDALWCGDVSLLWPEEFFETTLDLGREVEDYFNDIFDRVFRTVMPKELWPVLEKDA